jgi:hypothetical protein
VPSLACLEVTPREAMVLAFHDTSGIANLESRRFSQIVSRARSTGRGSFSLERGKFL